MQTCLVIDESSVIRKVASRIIFKLDFTVESAASAAEAMALTADALPDLVLVAGNLPDMPAEDLVREMRKRPNAGNSVVLATLVAANLGQMTRLKRAGANGFIYKPFDRAALSRWVEAYLPKAQAAAA